MLTREESEVGGVTGAIEPDAEPDPGAFEVPHRVDTARAVITHQEILHPETPLLLGKAASMDVVKSRCAGLDVHKKTVVACVRQPGPRSGERRGETQTFGTTMRGLGELRTWLLAHEVTDVAMESTGVYWRPVYAGLEGMEIGRAHV